MIFVVTRCVVVGQPPSSISFSVVTLKYLDSNL